MSCSLCRGLEVSSIRSVFFSILYFGATMSSSKILKPAVDSGRAIEMRMFSPFGTKLTCSSTVHTSVVLRGVKLKPQYFVL